MAATVSSVWAKPGAWALDSEEHEDELNQEIEFDRQKPYRPEPPVAEFPSLSAASATKPKKKNKGQTLSLAEFSNYSSAPKPAIFEPNRLTQDELIMLPTGPRERTAEELDRSRIGGGFRNYGGGGDFSRARVSDRNKEGYNSNSNRERDLGPSRADEVDDWSKTKRSSSFGVGPGPERPERPDRPERRERVGFFNSSRADDVDNWASNKSFSPSSEGPTRERRMGLGFESYSNGSGPDSDNWLKKKEREEENHGNDVGRPRLNLQPRTLPVNNGQVHLPGTETKPKGANPFGEARPREEVLAEKGKDWKEIDEKLEAVKIKEVGEGLTNKRRGFGISEFGDGDTVKSWRKPESNDAVLPSSAETTDNTETADNVPQGS